MSEPVAAIIRFDGDPEDLLERFDLGFTPPAKRIDALNAQTPGSSAWGSTCGSASPPSPAPPHG